ncbi:hypothetical protein [Butyrivibrio sp. XPD2002]|uniref:hypothetical protein n=1 Tax=Butyrivibrio sp. XPD2002 TaxID=1280665 RepID=UPI000424F055|nr:hypothetical protein [Butyrivibrio sp. XPD2002]
MPAPIADIFQVTKVLEFHDIPIVSSDFDIDVNKTYTLDELSLTAQSFISLFNETISQK